MVIFPLIYFDNDNTKIYISVFYENKLILIVNPRLVHIDCKSHPSLIG